MKPCKVTGVYTNDDGQTLLNTDYGGGPDGTPGVTNVLPAYYPQLGDDIYIEDAGGGVWVVTGCRTPNRGPVIPVVPTEEVANSAPGGWTQIATVFTEPGVTVNPRRYLVPSTVVIPPPPSTPTTVSFLAYAANSWRADFGGSWADTGKLYQGSYSGYGPWSAAWFYPSMTAALSGHTITGFRIHLHRAAPAGAGGPVQTHLFLHNHASQPVGAPVFISLPYEPAAAALSWEAAADVTLPTSWAQAIQNGTAAGIGISGTDQDTYSTLYGPNEDAASGQLFVDYT